MHFTTAGLLDDDESLRAALSKVPGLDADAVVGRIDDPEVVAAYEEDRAHARSAEGSPTHAQDRFSTSDGPVRYTAPSVIFEAADGSRLEVGGFQPFEAYDTALANLDVTLKRRRAPASALEALFTFPEGLTTAELASVMRPSDLVDADFETTTAELAELAAAGTVARDPAGTDAVWRASGRGGRRGRGGCSGLGRTAAVKESTVLPRGVYIPVRQDARRKPTPSPLL